MKKIRLSLISWMHYVKLVLRSILFLLVLVFYILGRVTELKNFYALPIAVWIFFVIEMILRFFRQGLRVWDVRSSLDAIINQMEIT